jgi:hypothetical protein
LRANWIFQITESEGLAEWMSAVERFVVAYAVAPIYPILFPVCGHRPGLADCFRSPAPTLREDGRRQESWAGEFCFLPLLPAEFRRHLDLAAQASP